MKGNYDVYKDKKIVPEKVEEFGLGFEKHNIASTHHRARDVKNIVGLLWLKLSYNYAIYFAMLDVFYTKENRILDNQRANSSRQEI